MEKNRSKGAFKTTHHGVIEGHRCHKRWSHWTSGWKKGVVFWYQEPSPIRYPTCINHLQSLKPHLAEIQRYSRDIDANPWMFQGILKQQKRCKSIIWCHPVDCLPPSSKNITSWCHHASSRERFEGCLKRQSSTSSPTCHQLIFRFPPAFNPNRLGEAKFHKSHGFKFPETAPGPPGPTLFGMSFQKTLHQISRQWRKRTGNLDIQTISFEALPEWKGERHSEIKTIYATELPFLVTSLLIWLPFPFKKSQAEKHCKPWHSNYDLPHLPSTFERKFLSLHDAPPESPPWQCGSPKPLDLEARDFMTSVAPMAAGGLVAWWLAKNHGNRSLGSYSKYMIIYVSLAMAMLWLCQ